MEEEFNVEKSKPLDYDRLIAENKRKLTTLIDISPVSNKHATRFQTVCGECSTQCHTC